MPWGEASGQPGANTTEPTSTVTYSYDALGRLDWVKSEQGATQVSKVSHGYDALGRRATETQEISALELVKIVGYGYDLDGNLASLTYPDGTVVDYTYTNRNQLKEVKSAGPPPVAGAAGSRAPGSG